MPEDDPTGDGGGLRETVVRWACLRRRRHDRPRPPIYSDIVRLPILVYHQIAIQPPGCWYPGNYVEPSDFAAQLGFLRKAGYSTISFSRYLEFLDGRGNLPRRPIILTFDDGYRSVLTSGYPCLSKYGFTASVFVVAACVGGTNDWDRNALQEPLLSSDEILELQRNGVEFQSHTYTHARLTAIPRQHASDELARSRSDLELLLGAPVHTISYPYGAYSAEVESLARDAGYRAGVITRRRLNRPTTNPLTLRRIAISNRTTLSRFAWDLMRLRVHGD